MSPELRLICAFCRWPDDSRRREAILAAAGECSDWDAVRGLATAHRVEGLVAHGLASCRGAIPDEIAKHFEAAGERVKTQALIDVAETVRIAAALDDVGVRHCILKGAPLGLRAYGSALLKRSWDVDVLVDPADAVAAARAISAVGYAPHLPPRPLTRAEFERWSAVSKEAELHSHNRAVELHWGLADHPMLLAGLGVAQADCRVELFDGRSVATLNDSANLAYLAVHGAFHGWSRLKWLADFAALVEQVPGGSRSEVLDQARRWPVGAALDQALLLSARLLGSDFAAAARPSPRAELLATLGATSLERRQAERDFEADRVASRAISRVRRDLMAGRRYRRLLFLRRLKGSEDRRLLPLPRGLQWAYWPLRPFTLAGRVAGRAAGRVRARFSF